MKTQTSIRRERLIIPTYLAGEPEKAPIFYEVRNNQGTRGNIYPLPMTDSVTDEKVDRAYDAIHLENAYIRVTVLPELGGRIYEGYDKVRDYHFVYKNNVIKPALIGLCGTWISGGIEFNWPQHHRPTTFMPVDAAIEENADGSKTAWVGEIEPLNGTKGRIGVTIYPDKAYIEAKVEIYNRTPMMQNFHWWANLAVHTNDNYQLLFPPDVDYITTHYKPQVADFPRITGKFMGVDYGQGTDVSMPKNVDASASFFIFDSDYNFMGGYDHGKQRGTVHIADKYVSPGKKFFTWGNHEFSQRWQRNLTDNDGAYIEIMTGVYTDNQPDFTWLAPFETKTFEQYWYCLEDMPHLKNAGLRGCISAVIEGSALKLDIGVTEPVENAQLSVVYKGKPLLSECVCAAPGNGIARLIPHIDALNDLRVVLLDNSGEEIIAYEQLPKYFADQSAPAAHTPAPRPNEVKTVEELYFHGMHIELYRHPTYKGEPYFLEALSREPMDSRSNHAMGVLEMRRGNYEKAAQYLENSVQSLLSRNMNAYDCQPLYDLGVVLKHMEQDKRAMRMLQKAAWNYPQRAAAMLEAARLAAKTGDLGNALKYVSTALKTNAMCLGSKNLLSAILRHLDRPSSAEINAAHDPLDATAAFEWSLSGGQVDFAFAKKPDAMIDVAIDYIAAGFFEDALKALSYAPKTHPLTHYYQAYCLNAQGKSALSALKKADAASKDYCAPNREWDFTVLTFASNAYDVGASAHYYLGNMFYARGNYDRAITAWEAAVNRDAHLAVARRNLSIAYYDKRGDAVGALVMMRKAFELDDTNPRFLYELTQLLKVSGTPLIERLALCERHMDLIRMRDDAYLQYITLLNASGQCDCAIDALKNHTFHPYEGGEGILPKQHIYAHLALGRDALAIGEPAAALEYFLTALDYPDNYNEGRKFFTREAHVYYYIALALNAQGDHDGRTMWLTKAVDEASDVDEAGYYRALALRALGRYSDAQKAFSDMRGVCEKQLAGDLKLSYFEGFPTALPFEQDVTRTRRLKFTLGAFYACIGQGDKRAAEQYAATARDLTDSALWVDWVNRTEH